MFSFFQKNKDVNGKAPPPPPPQNQRKSQQQLQPPQGSQATASTTSSSSTASVSMTSPTTSTADSFHQGTDHIGCFHDKKISELQTAEQCIVHFQDYANGPGFVQSMKHIGLVTPKFTPNKHLLSSCQSLTKFQDGFERGLHHNPQSTNAEVLGAPTHVGLAFHGTYERNIDDILQNGLDPGRRRGQAYGPGEYFSKEPGVSVYYCHGGKTMIVFAVLVPNRTTAEADYRLKLKQDGMGEAEIQSRVKQRFASSLNCPHDYVVVENNYHQVPIGTLSFSAVDNSVLQRSQAARSKFIHLKQKLAVQTKIAEEMKIKTKILQMIFRGADGFEQASRLWAKHCDHKKMSIMTKQVLDMMKNKNRPEDQNNEQDTENKEKTETEVKNEPDDSEIGGAAQKKDDKRDPDSTKYEFVYDDVDDEEEDEDMDDEYHVKKAAQFSKFVNRVNVFETGNSTLSYLSCREISHYYWKCSNRERAEREAVCAFFFPNLPPPMTIEERDSYASSTMSFDTAYQEMCLAQTNLDNAKRVVHGTAQS